MINVSRGWVDAHKKTLLPETFLEVTYSATEPGLQQFATATATNESSFSNAAQVTSFLSKSPEKYATLEHGAFGLDGTFDYSDGTLTDPGYITESLTDDGTVFAVIPTITVTLSRLSLNPLPGVTITWSKEFNEWATDFRVTVWANTSVVAQKTVNGNKSPVSHVELELPRFNKVTIEILRWSLPHHRARCIDVFLGIRNVYTKTDLTGFTHTQTVDLLSATLPKNEIVFRLRNEDQRWNPDNPTGLEQYLLTRQEVRVRYGMSVGDAVEWVKGGTFWLSGWDTPANGLEAIFTARDALEFMVEEYVGPKTGSLYDIAVAAFTQAELPVMDDGSIRYVVHESLKNYSTDFSADGSNQSYTVAQILQMVANASNCTLFQDRDGVVHLKPWEPVYAGYMLEPKICYTHPEYTMGKPLKSVSVGYGGNQNRVVVNVNSSGEVQTVDNILLRAESDAMRVGKHVGELLLNRKVISGDFRADVRLDALDNIIVTSKYASNVIAVTEISYSTTGGAFRGKYVGRVVSVALNPVDIRSNELYLGEV